MMRLYRDVLDDHAKSDIQTLVRGYNIRALRSHLTHRLVCSIGRIFGFTFGSIVIGRDETDFSSLMESWIIDGLRSSGAKIISIGEATTPMLYFATKDFCYSCGLMLTASHNGDLWGGIKIIGLHGSPICADEILAIISAYSDNGFDYSDGFEYEAIDFLDSYCKKLPRTTLRHSVAWFPGSSVAAKILKKVYECDVILHDQAEASQVMIQESYDFGLGFDIDGDRLIVFDRCGNPVENDVIIMLFAKYLLSEGGTDFILDYQIAEEVAAEIARLGGSVALSKPGHSVVRSLLIAQNADFAAEVSGHMYFKDHGYDDGIYAASQFLNMAPNGEYKELELNVYACSTVFRFPGNFSIILQEILARHDSCTISKEYNATMIYLNTGRIMLRESGTEDLIVLRIYGSSTGAVEHIVNSIAHITTPSLAPSI